MAFADTDIKPQIHYRDGLRGWINQVQRIGDCFTSTALIGTRKWAASRRC